MPCTFLHPVLSVPVQLKVEVASSPFFLPSHYIWDSIIAFDLYCTSKLDGFLACLVLFGAEIAP